MVIGINAGVMDDLAPYFTSQLGIAFKCENNKYMSVVYRHGHYGVECAKSYKDDWTRFKIYNMGGNRIALQGHNGRYVGRVYYSSSKQPMRSDKSSRDGTTILRVYKQSNGKISLRADNNRFLSCIYRSDAYYVEAVKYGVDSWSEFKFETGSLVPVQEEILDIKFDMPSLTNKGRVAVIGEDQIPNYGSRDVIKTFKFIKKVSQTQSTTWEHSWGITTGVSFTYGFSKIASGTATMTVSYNGKHSKTNAKTNEVTIEDSTTVHCPPHTRCKAELMIKEIPNIPVPFVATVKRTDDLGSHIFTERGTWIGQIFKSSYIKVTEQKLE